MTTAWKYILFDLIIVLYCILSVFNQIKHGTKRLREWAKDENVTIIKRSYRFFGKGPYAWKTSPKKALFHVTVRRYDGEFKSAWVLVGSSMFGTYSKELEVKWE